MGIKQGGINRASLRRAGAATSSGSGTIATVTSTDGTVTVTNPSGPSTDLSVSASEGKIQANWTVGICRVYAVDDTNGNDTNVGYVDPASSSTADFAIASAAAGLVAKKTILAITNILPRVGAGRQAVVVIRARAGNAQYADALDFLFGLSGYNAFCVYGTDTNATASAVAFAGNTADLIYAGAQTMTGANAAGYNPTGTPTTSIVQCVLNGGGAPGFAAEPALPLGARIRFDSATTTVALRNICRTVKQVTGTDTLTVDSILPAVPALADIFYLEIPGVLVKSSSVLCLPNASSQVQTAGIDFSTITGNWRNVNISMSFNHFRNSHNCINGSLTFTNFYTHPVVGSPTVGGNIFDGAAGGYTSCNVIIDSSIFRTPNIAIFNPLSCDIQVGSVFCKGLYIEGGGVSPGNNGVNSYVGRRSGNGNNPRVLAPGTASAGVAAGICLNGGRLTFGDFLITGMGASPAIAMIGECDVSFFGSNIPLGPNGSTGNTGVGLDLTQAIGSRLYLPNSGTSVTGTVGDVKLSDGTTATWAALLVTGMSDRSGNRFIAAGAAPTSVVKFSGGILGGVGATTSYLGDAGSVPAANLSVIEYPVSMRLLTRLRVKPESNSFATTVVATVYKNNVATSMTVNIPAGSTTVVSDTAHVVLYADGDTLSVVLSNAGDAAKTAFVMAVVEGPC
jgi:hypothetical protein